ncbi:DUF3967 domain-containing protein [Bacillus smithii]|uniref:DUF3967 domain-containing protein n=1 Tax=Bacillus smithii TaxID=1479 RepID=UPI002E21138D|nr:DUF3967 domain-containing protein [Bacillus smithii]
MYEVIVVSDTSNINFKDDVDVIYDTTSVSKVLGVQESTLRKYCALMQKSGYEFHKNSVGHRIFYEKDIDVLRKIVKLKNSSQLTLVESIRTVLNSDIDDVSGVKVQSDIAYNKLLEEFSLFKKQQKEFNNELLRQLQKQQDYIDNRLEQRDKLLMQSLKESLEARQQIASAKTKKWWKFWK